MPITKQDANKLLGEIKNNNPYINGVNFTKQGLNGNDPSFLNLVTALKNNTFINGLDFCSNELKDIGAKHIASIMQNNKFHYIDLADNDIIATGIHEIAKALEQENNGVKWINLGHNPFGNYGATKLGNALKKNDSLVEISLSQCDIGDKGAIALAEGIKVHKNLTKVSLGFNGIGDEGAKAIAQSLKDNKSLIWFSLRFNEIYRNGAAELAAQLEHNRTLTFFDIEWNRCKVYALPVCKIKQIIKRNRDLFHKMMTAIIQGNISEINEFLSQGISINQIGGLWSNIYGYSPMMIACKGGNKDVIATLLPYCKNLEARCETECETKLDNGNTALDFAKKHCDNETVELLIKAYLQAGYDVSSDLSENVQKKREEYDVMQQSSIFTPSWLSTTSHAPYPNPVVTERIIFDIHTFDTNKYSLHK